MRQINILLAVGLNLVLGLILGGCAYTRAYHANGTPWLVTQANASHLEAHSGNDSLVINGMDHSTPTTAGGAAFAQGTNAIGGAATGIILGAGSSGLFTKGASASKSLIMPTAAVASHVAAKPSVPKATPRPTAEQIWPENPTKTQP